MNIQMGLIAEPVLASTGRIGIQDELKSPEETAKEISAISD